MKFFVAFIGLCIFALVSAEEYDYSPEPLTYNQAREVCRSKNGILLEIRNKNANIAAWNFMKEKGIQRMWLGISRRRANNDAFPKLNWVWEKGVSDDPLTDNDGTTYWGPNEPNNYKNHSEQCGEMRYLAKNNEVANWNDRPCEHLNPFVCIKEQL